MLVKLIIRSGSQAGKAVPLPSPKCLIGRSEECHIRPQIDAISRKHCVITTRENEVVVQDLKSRNGTFVNNTRITGESVLLSGDVLRVGPVEFTVKLEQKKVKKSVVKDIRDVAQRTAGAGASASKDDMSDVSKWLDEADINERHKLKTEPETRQFRLDDTTNTGTLATQSNDATLEDTKAILPPQDEKDKEEEKSKSKKEPGKLPPRAATTTANSRDAAAEMLKKFFNRR